MFSRRLVLPALAASALAASPLAAQEPYRDPPAPIAQILDAPLTPAVSVSPDGKWLLLLERAGLPPIAEVAAPELRLAGARIDPKTNGPSRVNFLTGLRLRSVDGNVERVIAVPPVGRISNVSWAPTSDRIAFTLTGDYGIRLWVADVATGTAKIFSPRALNGTSGTPCIWVTGGTELICRFVPDGARVPPPESAPRGPATQDAIGRVAPNRTFQDLLKDGADEARFEHYFTSQLVRVSLDGGMTNLGAPAVYLGASPSPDGKWLLVQMVHRPWSYTVPMGRFPRLIALWDRDGKEVRQLADLPVQDEISPDFDAVPVGPRAMGWRAGTDATLIWAEALDGGDPKKPAEKRDRVRTLAAPFAGEGTTLIDLAYRYAGASWTADGRALVDEGWNKTRRTRTWFLGTGAPRLLFDLSSEDRYADPGSPAMTLGPRGWVIETTADGKGIYLDGLGASADGDRPFIRRMDLATGRTTELFRSSGAFYEEVVTLLDRDGRRILTRRESVDSAPNYFVRDLRARRVTQLTKFTDPAPQFAGLKPELITYQRADGVHLSAKLYLPPGYTRAQGPLPFFFWAYPQEFKTAEAASQVIGSPYRFTRPSGPSHLFLLTQGYGVLDGPTMPIIGEGDKEPNDSYVEQLVASAQAAVDKVVAMGVADRERIAVGGHSYGAFMTANLLAHSRIFRAGIARSGAYNRTLTPFGFQAEERTYWQAPEVYDRMSPFTYADSIKTPILFIHGMADDNAGTFPIQSERMFAAVKGTGGTARLVMLPAEAHGYRARESVGTTLAEMVAWLDRWVKAPPRS
jgi:dipeptidyl aminopeptidase/acylaminoacyl peptidase